jgi:L-asparaginase II
MSYPAYEPLLELKRGDTGESHHFGAIAVVNVSGDLVASVGDPQSVTFMRSTAKLFQALPFFELGGHEQFNLNDAEIALICSSHSGSDVHLATVQSLQKKTGVRESDLLCGVHPPLDEGTAERLRQEGQQPTSNRHNCSGKHTGMLAFARLQGWPVEDYLHPDHPVQRSILESLAEMSDLSQDQIRLGINGCSAPNFAIPLANAALALARLCDPSGLPSHRANACRAITNAMSAHPSMVAGQGRFDTRLMEAAAGRLIAKGGAEGYQGIVILPGTLGVDSPALGIAFKISDGDPKGRARPAVSLEVLRQLGGLSTAEMEKLADLGPTFPVLNWRKIVVGEARPCFTLDR